jgi:Zn-dependent protease with chaperone function
METAPVGQEANVLSGTPIPAAAASAVYFDGASSRKRAVALHFGDRLELIEDGAVVAAWAYDDIRSLDAPTDRLRVHATTALPLARLEIRDAPTRQALLSRCHALGARGEVGRGAWRIVFWSLAAIGSIIVVAVFGVPLAADRLAPLVPGFVEKRLGEATDRQVRLMFGDKVCTGAAGGAAFATLIDKLRRAGGIDTPLAAHVLASNVPNAFALPGGHVYLLNGLLQKAHSVDEIAGVLAHELGHVHNRDSLRKVIQNGGTSFLIGLLFGDVFGASAVIFASRSLIDASYSREAEARADAFAIEVMHKLGRPAKPLGDLLFRVTGAQANRGPTILASHPLTEDRMATIDKADRVAPGPEILGFGDWRALKDICKN